MMQVMEQAAHCQEWLEGTEEGRKYTPNLRRDVRTLIDTLMEIPSLVQTIVHGGSDLLAQFGLADVHTLPIPTDQEAAEALPYILAVHHMVYTSGEHDYSCGEPPAVCGSCWLPWTSAWRAAACCRAGCVPCWKRW